MAYLLASLLLFTAPAETAQAPVDDATRLVQANTAYDAGEYGKALETYKALAERHGSGALYYNLGNAYLRTGHLGEAIAAYRRGQYLEPRNQDIRANLAFARKSAGDALKPATPSVIQRTLFFWHYALSPGELLMGLLLFNVSFWLLWGLRLRFSASEILRWLSVATLLATFLLGGSFLIHRFFPERAAVVTASQANIYSGTSTDTVVRFQLHAGAEVSVVDRHDAWVRIRLPDGKDGWAEAEALDVLML